MIRLGGRGQLSLCGPPDGVPWRADLHVAAALGSGGRVTLWVMPLLEAAFVLDSPIDTQEVREAAFTVERRAEVILAGVHVDIQEGPSGEMQFVQAELLCTPEEAYTWLTYLLSELEGEDGYAELITVRIDGMEFQA